jgi:hypothetical protein
MNSYGKEDLIALPKEQAFEYIRELKKRWYFEFNEDTLLMTFNNGGYQANFNNHPLSKATIDFYVFNYGNCLDENDFPQKKTYELPSKRSTTFKF